MTSLTTVANALQGATPQNPYGSITPAQWRYLVADRAKRKRKAAKVMESHGVLPEKRAS
ncbi:hypothetical protein [Arthrobacter sp. AQ5-05]|uniref:hypothetical protein n=1 Tax=Arthrobacter sp. AQ5-05 TaxID=2184581 RepID=UPI0015EBCD82|nr:hypothetical protein [Arthrobacter sp. AQ5-05]